MSDWLPLRDHLCADLEAQLDEMILHDPDPEARAFLDGNRERILERLVDKAELVTMRQALASRDGQHEQIDVAATSIIKLNGRKAKVAQ